MLHWGKLSANRFRQSLAESNGRQKLKSQMWILLKWALLSPPKGRAIRSSKTIWKSPNSKVLNLITSLRQSRARVPNLPLTTSCGHLKLRNKASRLQPSRPKRRLICLKRQRRWRRNVPCLTNNSLSVQTYSKSWVSLKMMKSGTHWSRKKIATRPGTSVTV